MEPQTPPSLPPRRWWRHWAFKTFGILLTLLILAIVAFYTIERALGERAWKVYEKKALANGVKLRIEDYETPAIADEENYATAPIFRKLLASAKERKEFEQQFALPAPSRNKLTYADAKPLDLTSWQQTFAEAGLIAHAGIDPAADILRALERMEGPLSEVRLASVRPKCHWPQSWGEGMTINLPYYGGLMSVGKALALRARALLASDRPEEALSELRHLIRLEQTLSSEPTLIPGLVRLAIWAQFLDICEQGLAANKWKPDHEKAIAKIASEINPLAAWKFSLSSERAFGNRVLDKLVKSRRGEIAEMMDSLAGRPSVPGMTLWYLMPRGWLRYNQVEYNEFLDLDLEDIDAVNGRVASGFSRTEALMTQQSAYPQTRIYHLFTQLLMPVTIQGSHRAFDAHSRMQALQILCAIAQYREAHGEVPQSLDVLAPEYLSAIPHDIMDGKPIRYHRKEDGGCAVWSIGVNRIDDGGARGKNTEPRVKAPDWVVELPPASGMH